MSYDSEYNLGEFQPDPNQQDRWNSPIVIARATDNIMGMLQSGTLDDTSVAFDYLNQETLGFLSRAKQGSRHYNDTANEGEGFGIETRESFGLALVTFGEMKQTRIPGFDLTFSRRGMLRAPETANQASERINEMETVIRRIIRGGRAPRPPRFLGQTSIAEFRTLAFFKTAHSIPFRQALNSKDS